MTIWPYAIYPDAHMVRTVLLFKGTYPISWKKKKRRDKYCLLTYLLTYYVAHMPKIRRPYDYLKGRIQSTFQLKTPAGYLLTIPYHTIWELLICPNSFTFPFNALMPYYTYLLYHMEICHMLVCPNAIGLYGHMPICPYAHMPYLLTVYGNMPCAV